MLYLTPPSSQRLRDAITAGTFGAIATPKQGNKILPGWRWAADNGCFGNGYPGDAGYVAWLEKMSDRADSCLFAVAPDVVCDAEATLRRSAPFLPILRELGYRPAFVLQNGVSPGMVPWDEIGAVFIGGDDAFKTSHAARCIVDMARAAGLGTHMGRVNTLGRVLDGARMGCTTADGRTMALFPATIDQMERWLADGRVRQGLLW
jgi:hypothetical protein